MTGVDVVVVGGGPAGVAAACVVARAGLSTMLMDQRSALGGALHVQPVAGVPAVPMPRRQTTRWRRLTDDLTALPVETRLMTRFSGLDAAGIAIVEDRANESVSPIRARGIVLAVGAVESIVPRPGWDLPGVLTVGGLQVMMKQSGRLPPGRIVLAGSGPLLVAAATQMAALGRSPLAVFEAATPVGAPLAAAALALHPAYAAEALSYLTKLWTARVLWRTRHRLAAISRTDAGLVLTVDGPGGRSSIGADWVGLHDGLRPNDFGLPADGRGGEAGPIVLRAGDCHEVLGGDAAIADGRRAGAEMVRLLAGGGASWAATTALRRHRQAQAAIAGMFRSEPPDLGGLPDSTMLCRCEGKTIGDLRALINGSEGQHAREVKLNGRFSMGACQGRLCAAWTAALMQRGTGDGGPTGRDFTGRRWPTLPVPISAFLEPDQSVTSRDLTFDGVMADRRPDPSPSAT